MLHTNKQSNKETEASVVRRQVLVKEILTYEIELEASNLVVKMREKLKADKNTETSVPENNVNGSPTLPCCTIETETEGYVHHHRPLYNRNMATVTLDLHSIVDLGITYQSLPLLLISSQQRDKIKEKYESEEYKDRSHSEIIRMFKLSPVKDGGFRNRLAWMAKIATFLKDECQHTDFSFCSFLKCEISSLIANRPGLFEEKSSSHEWDCIPKFWTAVFERLFHDTPLGFKWGHNHLIYKNAETGVDCVANTIITNKQVSRGEPKDEYELVSDRCALSIENKLFLRKISFNGSKPSYTASLHIFGLEIHFLCTCREKIKLYVTSDLAKHKIDSNTADSLNLMELALKLLLFKEECLSFHEKYNVHLGPKKK